MKKLLLATAISALSIGAAQAAPTVYGKLHVSIDSVDKQKATDTDNVFEVNSNASRIGVKGDEKLTDNLSVIYLAEWQVNTDGTDNDLSQRNRYVGLNYAGIGAVKVGKWDSYTKLAQGKVDYFNDMTYLDITKQLAGENRLNNVIGFESDAKALGGLGFNLMLQQGEGTKLAGDNSAGEDDSIGDAISASVVYNNKDLGLYTALAGDKDVVSKFNGAGGVSAQAEIIRLAGSLDMGALANVPGLVLNAMFQNAQPSNLPKNPKDAILKTLDQETSFLVSAAYTIGETPWTVKAQYHQATTEFTNNTKDVKLSQVGGIVDYAFNSKTRAYGYIAQQSDDRKGKDDLNHVGIGLEFNF